MLQAMILWAYATLGERMGDACLAALVGQARKEMQHFSVQNLAMVLWSLCVAQVSREASARAPTLLCWPAASAAARLLSTICYLVFLFLRVSADQKYHYRHGSLQGFWLAEMRRGALAHHHGGAPHTLSAASGSTYHTSFPDLSGESFR